MWLNTTSVLWVTPLAAGVAAALAFVGLRAVGVGTPAAMKSLNRALHAHGYIDDVSWLGKLERRSNLVRRLLQNLNLDHHLAVLGVAETSFAYLGKSFGLALITLGVGLFLDGLGFVDGVGWFVDPVLIVVVALVVLGLRVERVRRMSQKRGVALDLSIRAVLPLLAAAMAAPGLQMAAVLQSLASCLDHPDLHLVLSRDAWRKVLPEVPARASTDEIYQAIGESYDSKLFVRLGKTIVSGRTSGVNEGEAVGQMARVAFEEELDEINDVVAKAPTRAMFIIAGLVLLLLSIILVPLVGAFAQL